MQTTTTIDPFWSISVYQDPFYRFHFLSEILIWWNCETAHAFQVISSVSWMISCSSFSSLSSFKAKYNYNDVKPTSSFSYIPLPNCNLSDEVQTKTFRSDQFHRVFLTILQILQLVMKRYKASFNVIFSKMGVINIFRRGQCEKQSLILEDPSH